MSIKVYLWIVTVTRNPPIRSNTQESPAWHFQQTVTICKLIRDIIKTNVLTKCYDVWNINATIRVKTCPSRPHLSCFQPTGTIFEILQDIIGKNLLTKVLTRFYFKTGTILKLVEDIIRTIFLIKFHEDWTINVTLRLKNASPPDIIGANLSTKFHEDKTINSINKEKCTPTDIIGTTLLTKKNTPPPGGHVLQPTQTIFELVQDIIGTNLLTMFHDDWTRNMAFRILTRKNAPPTWGPYIVTINVSSRVLTRKHAPPPSCHVFKATKTIFKLFHDDRKINVASRALTCKNAPPPSGFVFLPIGIIFELVQYIIGMNHVTKALTTFKYSHIQTYKGKCPALGSHVFQANLTIFKLIHDIIETNLLAKFHEDWK
ncbi:hypothetical protein DPMN_029284 [Dreissena polymorpha]|uniref:Uncharacterized protein n=1 Tax=Dreissena polymorpha TaxID=45954 RepID=A0A9D4LW66_DREPO|nr:hypothetical protein DPMN_029284 [Dreissena polymorpha]